MVREIRSGEPGNRFHRYWEQRQTGERGHSVRRVLIVILGFFLVIAGALLGPTPVIPGFLIGIPGLALLAAEVKFFAVSLDKGELILRRVWRFLRRR